MSPRDMMWGFIHSIIVKNHINLTLKGKLFPVYIKAYCNIFLKMYFWGSQASGKELEDKKIAILQIETNFLAMCGETEIWPMGSKLRITISLCHPLIRGPPHCVQASPCGHTQAPASPGSTSPASIWTSSFKKVSQAWIVFQKRILLKLNQANDITRGS